MKLIFNSNNSQHLTLTLTFGKHGVLQLFFYKNCTKKTSVFLSLKRVYYCYILKKI
ncbi:hypothetical protein HanRHA438_Chr01g0038631 [Helianthus annuus]|nr:hypothetical protein HanRHA438_Chr01g0038631 [Helianthus annuus]